MKHKIISILLVFTLVVGIAALPCSVMAAEETQAAVGESSGTTGNCTWTLDDNGVLTISGEGRTDSYTREPTPWGTEIKEVVIENGVTKIGYGAFRNCTE